MKSILAVMLMATEHALTMPKASNWLREKWLTHRSKRFHPPADT
ncbi:hypothetical protein [Ferrovum sp.]|nr:hypothetical protein [Ferrovum sp.]